MEVKKFFESRFGSALTSGVEETSREYSKEKLDGEDLRMDMRMDLNTRVLYGDFVPVQRGIEESKIHLVPSLLAVLNKGGEECKVEGRKGARGNAELARQAKAKLELDPVYKEEQLEREVEREALAQRRRDEEAAEEQRRRDVEAAEAQRRRDELQARRDQMDMWYEGRKIAESRAKTADVGCSGGAAAAYEEREVFGGIA